MTGQPHGQPTVYLEPFVPARLEKSPHRERLERAAANRGFAVHWWKWETGDWVTLRVEVRNRDLMVVKRAGLSKLADRYDEAKLAEGVAEWALEPRETGVAAA